MISDATRNSRPGSARWSPSANDAHIWSETPIGPAAVTRDATKANGSAVSVQVACGRSGEAAMARGDSSSGTTSVAAPSFERTRQVRRSLEKIR